MGPRMDFEAKGWLRRAIDLALVFQLFRSSYALTPDFEAHFLSGHLFGNETGCGMTCANIEDWEPPPDMILTMPPPPLTPFLQQALLENQSLREEEGRCNFCHLFHDKALDSEFILPKPAVKSSDSWLSLLVASILGSTVFGAFLLVFLIKCKKWKIFPVTDSCPILPESFLGGHKTAPPPCSPTDSCISPVVNEKSPQSVITDAPTKKTSISSKYWRRGSDYEESRRQGINGGGPGSANVLGMGIGMGMALDPTSEMEEHYSACTEAPSCTSSPVYAELDAGMNHSNLPILISGGSQSISPYAVHTYTEVADAMRMAALGSSSALLPDASYDNAAYLPSSISDHYHTRSLRRHRAATLAQLGSATPLLSAHHNLNGSPPVAYLTGGRPQKKPRPPFAHHLPRTNVLRMQEDLEGSQLNRQPRYGSGRRHHGIYSDLPVHSPTMSTFRVPYAFREQPKRPLPPVPGVRL